MLTTKNDLLLSVPFLCAITLPAAVSGQLADLVIGTPAWDGSMPKGYAYLVMRIEVVDPFDGMPISGAEILLDDGAERPTLKTGGDGVGVVVFQQPVNLRSYSITVRAPSRLQWQLDASSTEIEQSSEHVSIWASRDELSRATWDDYDRVILEAVRARRYRATEYGPPPVDPERFAVVWWCCSSAGGASTGGFLLWTQTVEMHRRRGPRFESPANGISCK